MNQRQGMSIAWVACALLAVCACGSGRRDGADSGEAGSGSAAAGDSGAAGSGRGGGRASGGTLTEGDSAGEDGSNSAGASGVGTSGANGMSSGGLGGAGASEAGGMSSGSAGTSASGTSGVGSSGSGGRSMGGTGGMVGGGSGGTSASGSGGLGAGGLGAGAAPNGSSCTHGGLCESGHCAGDQCAVAPNWGTAITLSAAPGAPSVVLASFGEGVVAWRDDPRDQVLARVASAKSFGAETRIDTNGAAMSVSDPKLARSGGQSFVATWSESFSSSDYRVFARPFAGSWGNSTDIDGSTGPMQLPRIATNAQGNGAVVWNGRDDSFVWLRAVTGASFGVPQNFSFGYDQAVAVSPSGRIAAAWCVAVTGTADLWVATYQPGVGWGAPARAYEGTLGGACYHPAIAIDDAGQMAVTWSDGPSVGRPYARYFSVAGGWESSALIEPNIIYGSIGTAPVFSASGALLLVWYRIDSSISSCQVRYRLHLGNAWTADQTLDECRDGSGIPTVATYDQESFRVIYHHKSPNSSGRELWDARYVGGQGFRDLRLVSPVAWVQSAPALALDPSGKGLLSFVYRVGHENTDPSELRAIWLE